MSGNILKFRSQISAEGVVPRWLRGFNGVRFLYAIGLQLDILADFLTKGVKARLPGFCETATPYICRDRGLIRGPEEDTAQISERARSWQQDACVKGSPIASLRQLQAYLTPHSPRIRLINNQGRYFEISTDGSISWGDASWNWDGDSTLNTRFWVLIWVPSTLWQSDGTFASDGLIGDGGVIGSTASRGIVSGVQRVIREWSSENSRHMHTILIFDDTAWQAQQPDGTWQRMDRRNPSANYWNGDQ